MAFFKVLILVLLVAYQGQGFVIQRLNSLLPERDSSTTSETFGPRSRTDPAETKGINLKNLLTAIIFAGFALCVFITIFILCYWCNKRNSGRSPMVPKSRVPLPRVGLRQGRQNFKTRDDYLARIKRLHDESLARRKLAADAAAVAPAAAAQAQLPPSPPLNKKGSLPKMVPLSPYRCTL